MDVDHSINLKSGSIIQGKYEVLRCLGAGSMGMVYAVKHLDLQDRILAMKVLYSDVAKDEVQAARFKNEIVASYEVNHPNVVRAYDYFKEGDLIAYTMEYVSGGDLADRLNDENLITIKDSIAMLKQMASGLAVIHKAGIIHRDLKPENILISSDGSIKITDFGIARTVKGPRLTDHGGIVGTFAYVSPEYLEYGKLDCRSDIYSIGVLAYEMIVGNAPHDCANVIESMHAKLSTDPKEPYLLRKECPRALSDVVMKALARNPDNRFQSAEELYSSLAGINEDVGVAVKRVNGGQLSDKPVEVPVNKTQRKVADSEIANMIEGLKESLEGGSSGNYPERNYESTIIKPHVINQPAVTISQGRLSAQRFKELQEDLGSRKVGFSFSNILSWFSAIFTGLLTFIVGALVGLLALKHSSLSSFSYVWSMISHYFNVE